MNIREKMARMVVAFIRKNDEPEDFPDWEMLSKTSQNHLLELADHILALAQEDCPECGESFKYGDGSYVWDEKNGRPIFQSCSKCNGKGKVPLEMKQISEDEIRHINFCDKYDNCNLCASGCLKIAKAQLAADKDVMAIRLLGDKVDKGGELKWNYLQ